jgi:hypothetical protein
MKKNQQFASVLTRYSLILLIVSILVGIFITYDSFNITSNWFKKDELESRETDQSQNTNKTSITPLSIEVSGNILSTLPLTLVKSTLAPTLAVDKQTNVLIGSVDCQGSLVDNACESSTITNVLPNFSVVELLNTPAKSLNSLRSSAETAGKKPYVFTQQTNDICSTIPLPVEIIYPKKREKKEIPFAYCSINANYSSNLDTIKQFGDFMPTVIIIKSENSEISQSVVDVLIKLNPDMVIIKSSSKNLNLNWKNTPASQLPILVKDNSNSLAVQFSMQFAKDATTNKYFDETTPCIQLPESCLSLLQKNMIKKPSIQIKNQVAPFKLETI